VISLGFGHPIPIALAVFGVVDACALPFLAVAYVRAVLAPHPTPEEES